MKRSVPVVVVLLVVLVAAGVWAVLQARETTVGDEALQASGTVEAREIQIAPLAAGRVETLTVEVGDEVDPDQVLAELDPALLQAQVEQAQAAVDAAEAGLDQVEADEGSDAEVAAARARVDQAKARLEAARIQLRHATVTAPVAGTVVVIAVEQGENATPGRNMLTLADLSELYVSVYVPETRIGEVTLGQDVQVTTDSSTRSFGGEVTWVASEAEFTPSNVETREQRTKLVYEVRVSVASGDGVLKPGMPVDVAFR